MITRHIWEPYIEICEDLRHTKGNKDLYDKRKETIERLFGTAKEHHGLRYTQLKGKARMEMKVGLTFACLNLKKLALLLDFRAKGANAFDCIFTFFLNLFDFKPSFA